MKYRNIRKCIDKKKRVRSNSYDSLLKKNKTLVLTCKILKKNVKRKIENITVFVLVEVVKYN